MLQQIHAYYTGRVQGVGFRYTAIDLAGDLGVTGWVRNLRDGRVEVVAEADEEVLVDFLDKLGRYFSRYIQDTDVQWLAATGEYKDFTVRF